MYAKTPPVWRMTKAHTIDAGSIKNSRKKNQPSAFLLTVSTTTSWRVGFFAALTCNRERRKWVNRCEKLMQQHYLTNLCECMWPLTTVTCLAPELENSHTTCPHYLTWGIPLERHLMREQRHKSNYSYWLWPNTHKKVSTAQWPCRLKKITSLIKLRFAWSPP